VAGSIWAEANPTSLIGSDSTGERDQIGVGRKMEAAVVGAARPSWRVGLGSSAPVGPGPTWNVTKRRSSFIQHISRILKFVKQEMCQINFFLLILM
jgi:hypothetical protein